MEPDPAEIRVLGCLIEKQRTTPDQYPLTINALRLACNQATNRDPVVEYDEGMVRAALERLGRRRWTRMASWSSSRAVKYRHMLNEELRVSSAEMALLGVLMLRGPQTPGELRQRSERLHAFASGEEVDATLEALMERGLAGRLPRRPGQREQRYAQLLGGEVPSELEPGVEQGTAAGGALPEPELRDQPAVSARTGPLEAPDRPSAPEPVSHRAVMSADPALEERMGELERQVRELREQLTVLRDELGA